MAWALFSLLISFAIAAHDSQAQTPIHDQESYEKSAIDAELDRLGWERHSSPEGATVSEIQIQVLDIFQKRDAYPDWLNSLHHKTENWVIEREILLQAGNSYTDDYAYESERILRNYLYISWARVIPAKLKGSSLSDVKILIVAQDLWSLRPGIDFSFVGSRLENLDLAITESNFLGQAQVIGPIIHYDLGAFHLGGLYRNYRFGKTNYGGRIDARTIINKNTGTYEGERVNASLTRPLIRLDDQWGAELSLSYNRDIYRSFTNGALATVNIAETGESPGLIYNRKTLDFSATLTRSFGRTFKSNWTFGYGYFSKLYPIYQTGLNTLTTELFTARYLPISESAGYLSIKWDGFEATYERRMNLDSFAVTEDIRKGLNATLSLSAAVPALGGSSYFLTPSLRLGYNWFFGDALLVASTQVSSRIQPGVDPKTSLVNRLTNTSLKYYSTYFGRFRWVAAGQWIAHGFDRFRTLETLGGETTLRGFPSSWLRGTQLLTFSQEIRSEPIYLLSTYIGFVAFQDWGDAFDDYGNMRLRPTIGGGLRIGFVNFNRDVVRFDIGFPLHALDQGLGPTTVIQFDQAI